jgi:hypothetical protein
MFQRIGVPTYQRLSASAHQRISASAHRRISASAHRRVGASVHQRIGASSHRRIALVLARECSRTGAPAFAFGVSPRPRSLTLAHSQALLRLHGSHPHALAFACGRQHGHQFHYSFPSSHHLRPSSTTFHNPNDKWPCRSRPTPTIYSTSYTAQARAELEGFRLLAATNLPNIRPRFPPLQLTFNSFPKSSTTSPNLQPLSKATHHLT